MRKQKKPFQEKNAVKCGYDPRNTNDPTSPADDKCLFKWQDYVNLLSNVELLYNRQDSCNYSLHIKIM